MALGSGNIDIDIRGNLDTSRLSRQVAQAEKQLRPLQIGLNDKGFRQPLGRISGDLAEFQKSLDASVARTLAFGAAVGVINAVSDAFKNMVTSAIEVEKSLANVNVILNLSTASLADFSSNLFDVAKNTGQTFQTVSEAAVELSRQGLGAEETLKRINDAMILTRLSGMDAAKSVETLTAAVNSFGSAALTTTDLVNKLATVDAAFAVSTEDLANALARAGSTAQAAKVNLDQLLAAVTSVQQTTARGGSVIGNAFKSIFTRIQRSGVREALEEIGVATTDSAGNIRNALDILSDYAGVYKSLSDGQRAYTDELVAGVFQINNLRALVKDLSGDYSIYQRALDKSNSATDDAIRRNEELQKTLATLVNESAVNVKELSASLGNLVATPAIENLLNVFNSIANALQTALDPEKGSKLIQGMFSAIGSFISGPGLILIAAAFIKLFKFITGQSLKAANEVFKIGQSTNKVADAEQKISFLLKNNYALYSAISNESLDHKQKEEMILRTIRQQNAEYSAQQMLIGRLAQSRAIQGSLSASNAGGFTPSAAKGYIPNFANGLQGAIKSEESAIKMGEGGASKSARPKVLNNFPMGGGKKQTVVANTDEVIIPNFGGGNGSAIFNKDMIKKAGGAPKNAIAVSGGFIPNFAKPSALQDDKNFQSLLGSFQGINIDVQRDFTGFGMLSAKGIRDNMSATRQPGFSKTKKLELIDQLGGSKLSKEDKDYLMSTLGTKKKTRFSNIPAQTIESADPKEIRGKVGALNNLINPYIANAVASVSAGIYTRVLGDEVQAQSLVNSVRGQAEADKGILSVSAQGDIFESAIRLGSIESAKGLARDDRSAIWDFEESGNMSPDLKGLFFPTSNIRKADAKRSGDPQSLGEVIDKAYKEDFDKELKKSYLQAWGPIVDAASKVAPSKAPATRSRTGTNFAGGYIPNFATSGPLDVYNKFVDIYKKTGNRPLNKEVPGYNSATYKRANKLFMEGEAQGVQRKDGKQGIAGLWPNYEQEFKSKGWNSETDNSIKWWEKGKGGRAEEILLGNLQGIVSRKYGSPLLNEWDDQELKKELIKRARVNSKITDLRGHSVGEIDKIGNSKIMQFRNSMQSVLGLDNIVMKTASTLSSAFNPDDYYFDTKNSGSKKATGQEIMSEFAGIAKANPRTFAGGKPPQSLLKDKTKLDNFKKSNFTIPNFKNIVLKDKKTKTEQNQSKLKKLKLASTWKDWEELIQKVNSYGKKTDSINPSYPVDFLGPPIADAKFGKDARRGDTHVVGKALRHVSMTGGITGWNNKTSIAFSRKPGNFDLGNMHLINAYSSGYIPNFNEAGRRQRTVRKDRTLDFQNWFPSGLDSQVNQMQGGESSSGSKDLLRTYKEMKSAAKAGKPYTRLKAGNIVGPRIPRILWESHQFLNKKRNEVPPLKKLEGFLNVSSIIKNSFENADAGKNYPSQYSKNAKIPQPGGGFRRGGEEYASLAYLEKLSRGKFRVGELRQDVEEMMGYMDDDSGEEYPDELIFDKGEDTEQRRPFRDVDKLSYMADGYEIESLNYPDLPLSQVFPKGFSKGFIPNFAQLFKTYDNQGRHVGSENDFFLAKNTEQAGLMMKNNRHIRKQISRAQKIRQFNISDSMWDLLKSENPMEVLNREGLNLPKLSTDERKFMAQTASTYNIKPPFFKPAGGGAFSTSLTASPAHLAMFGLDKASGVESNFPRSRKSLNKSKGFIPNFALGTEQFNQLSNAIAEFNPRVNPDIRTAVSGEKQIRLNSRNADNVRQFLNSNIFRELTRPIQEDTAEYVSRKAQTLIQQFRQNPRIVKNLEGLKNATRPYFKSKETIKPLRVASRGFIPNFQLSTKEFNQLSAALAKFNPRVNPDIRTNRSGDRQIKLNARNADNVRQFLISDIFRKELERPIQEDTAEHVSRRAQDLIAQFRQNPRTVKNLQGLKNATRPYFKSQEMSKPLEVASRGFIPNFTNSLQDAIAREKSALNLQGSSAQVYVDKDERLKNSKNPTGLLVANTRDEPSKGSQGVNRAISMGMDPKKHGMAAGHIPNFISGAGISKTDFSKFMPEAQIITDFAEASKEVGDSAKKASKSIKEQGKQTKKTGIAVGDSMGKILGLQFGLTALGEVFQVQTDGLQTSLGILQTAEGVIPGFTQKLGKFGIALQAGALVVGVAADIYSQFFDAQNLTIKRIEAESEARKDQINTIQQNIEKIDQFATVTSKFSDAAKTGNITTAGKFMQEIFKQGQELGKLDPGGFQEIIDSIGDTEKLNAAVESFKNTASIGKNLKVAENDFANLIKSFNESINETQVFGIFDNPFEGVDVSKFDKDFSRIATTLTQGLPDEKVLELSSALEGFDSRAGNSSDKIIELQTVFGQLDASTVSYIQKNEALASGVVEQIRVQNAYASSVVKAKQAFEISQSPIKVLNDSLNKLSQSFISTAASSKNAIDILTSIGEIESKSNLSSLQATSTISQPNLLAGQAAGDITNSRNQSAREQENALKNFAGELIKSNKEGTTILSSGLQAIVSGIASGDLSNTEAINGLLEVQKTGSPEQKEAANKTIQELQKINLNQIKSESTINANLQSQLQALTTQSLTFQRNNQLSVDQLKTLSNFDNVFKEGLAVEKSGLERISELKNAISTIESLGGNTDILSALKEQNAQLSQLENLQSAFESLTGVDSQAESLEGLKEELLDFDLTSVEGQVADLVIALKDGIDTAIQSSKGVKGQEDVEKASLVTFDSSALSDLSSALKQAISEPLAALLNISPDLAKQLTDNIDTQSLAGEIGRLSATNQENEQKNAQLQKDIFGSLAQSIQDADFGSSTDSLEKAAVSLNNAADKITAAYSAEGFVPNYASTGGVERALQTERAMGAKRPVVDSHSSIGKYVRDAATQPNFAAVRRDHPEGIQQATKNSKNIQGAKAIGFVPNFQGEVRRKNRREQATSTPASKPFPQDFLEQYIEKLASKNNNKIDNYKKWNTQHKNVQDGIIDENNKDHVTKANALIQAAAVTQFNPLLVAERSNKLGYLNQPIIRSGVASIDLNASLGETTKYLSIYNSILEKGVGGLGIEDLYKTQEGNTFYTRNQIAKRIGPTKDLGVFKLPFSILNLKDQDGLDYNSSPALYTEKILQDLEGSILQKTMVGTIGQREYEILDIIKKSRGYINEVKNNPSWKNAPSYFDSNFNKIEPEGFDSNARKNMLLDAKELDKNISIRYGFNHEMAEDFISKYRKGNDIQNAVQNLKSNLIASNSSNINQAYANLDQKSAKNFDSGILEFLEERKEKLKEQTKDQGVKGSAAKEELKTINEIQKQVESETANFQGEVSGVEQLISSKKEEDKQERIQDIKASRNLLYSALIGENIQERNRIGKGSFADSKKRVELVKGKLSMYPAYIDQLLKPRKERSKRFDELLESGSSRQGANIRELKNRNDSIIEALEERKDLYSSEEGVGHLYFAQANKLTRIDGEYLGKSIWDSLPNYKSLWESEKMKLGMDGEKVSDEAKSILERFKGPRAEATNFARIQKGLFYQEFQGSNEAEREKLLTSIGARKEENDNFFQESTEDIDRSKILKSVGGDPRMQFLLHEMSKSKTENNAKVNEAILSKIKKIGIPFLNTQPVDQILKSKRIELETAKGRSVTTEAIDSERVDALLNGIKRSQLKAFKEKNKQFLEEQGIADSPTLIDIIAGQKIEDLEKYPIYIKYLVENQGRNLSEHVRSMLDKSNSVPNLENWVKKYDSNNLNLISKLTGRSTDNYDFYGPLGEINNAKDFVPSKILGEFENPEDKVREILGSSLKHGINQDFETFINNNSHPFPSVQGELTDLSGFREQAYAAAKGIQKKYAPAGYGKEHQAVSPSGNYDLIKELILGGEEGKAKGFVPNFSAVAGEIAASKVAGYKTPVRASQVKTMNIPGEGKTAYNTQESVFKLSGMSQPFIAPPSNSKAASKYAKAVQSKFNFNPYSRAADGFIPNFAPGGESMDVTAINNLINGFQSVIRTFTESTSNFQQAVSSLNFEDLSSASQNILSSTQASETQSQALQQAAALMKEGADAISQNQGQQGDVNFEELTSAASTISSSINNLSSQLSETLSIDSSSIESSMATLTAALGNIQGTVDVNVPNINVNVAGAGSITASVRSLIQREVPKMVAQEMQNFDIASTIKNFLR